MKHRDYYEVLGIRRTAEAEEIKRAYRRLAVQYHPDRNPNNAEAENRFKEISEAYAVLSDRDNRRKYDRFGHAGFRNQHTDEDIFRNFDVGDMFKDFGFGNEDMFSHLFGGRRSRRKAYRTDNDGFSQFFGDFGQDPRPPRRKGADVSYDLHLSLAESVFGAERLIAYNSNDGVVKVTVQVPPGSRNGQVLRLSGQGRPSPDSGGRSGDLVVHMIVAPNERFQRSGDDLITEVKIKPSEALLGGQVQVTTLDGATLNLKIQPGVQSHTKLRVRGHGAPRANGRGRGDLLARVVVDVPERLSDRQKELLQALADEGL
jgi:curved DNA-binding protein